MNDLSQQIVGKVCNDHRFSLDVIRGLEGHPEFRHSLRIAIEEQAVKQNWTCLCRLVWILGRFPNPDLVPLLARLLDERGNDGIMEALVDTLNIMRDARAVESLKHALSYRMPGDDLAFHFNKKVINALARMGTPEAESAIAEASRDPEEAISSFAKTMLIELQKGPGSSQTG